MKLSEALSALNAEHDPKLIELLASHWEYSVASEPRDWKLLQRAHWQECRAWCGCDVKVDAALEEVTSQISLSPALHLLAWHCCRLIFEVEDYNRFPEWTALLPLLEEIRPELRNAFFLLLALDAVPRLRQRNEQRGVPEKITRDTLGDVAIATRRFARYNDGAIGIEPRLLAWHRLVALGELFRVGRFEYHVRSFLAGVRVYRHRVSRRVLALSEPDVAYSSSGHRLLPNSQGDFALRNQTPAWTSTFHETATSIRAHPVSPRGFALEQPIEIPTAEWRLVFTGGDKVLVVHIPEGESVTLENSRESFICARQFFAEQIQEYSLRAFATNSWMLNTQLETMLPPTSKMLAWQRELYLFPVASTGKDGLYFVFNRDEIDLATAPRDTTLRRAMIEHLQAGNQLRSGGMFFLFDDLPQYGTQVYRKMQDGFDSSDFFRR